MSGYRGRSGPNPWQQQRREQAATALEAALWDRGITTEAEARTLDARTRADVATAAGVSASPETWDLLLTFMADYDSHRARRKDA